MRSEERVTRLLLKTWPPDFRTTSHVSLIFSDNSLVPDDIIIDLVRDRLERPDCRMNGWILEGCPMNQNQIKQIRDLMIVPQVVVAFELSD